MQIQYLRDVNAPEAADCLRDRVLAFIDKHLANFPRTGHELVDHDMWEIWIPKTRLVLWYQIKDDAVMIVTVWHHAQDRFSSSQA